MTIKVRSTLAALVMSAALTAPCAAQTAQSIPSAAASITNTLKTLYPATNFGEINPTP